MKAGIESKKRWLILVFLVASLVPHEGVAAPTMQFFPARIAPLGSPVATFGDPVTPTFNEALDCWELKVPGGVDVELDIQAFGWGDEHGRPLGTIQATVISAGYDNGVGAPLNPKGWPGSPGDGAYMPKKYCNPRFGGDGRPCVAPFSLSCAVGGDICTHNPDYVMPSVNEDFPAVATRTLDYAWATAVSVGAAIDDGEIKTLGVLILEVPLDAAGTYVIGINPSPDFSWMLILESYFRLDLHSACITIIGGACCVDTDSDGHRDTCHDDGSESDCVVANGLFLGDAVPCTGVVGACCLDGDGDGFDETCREMAGDCCDAQGGSFLGAAVACAGLEGACCLDGDGLAETCRVMDPICCDAQGGSFLGAGTCDNARGACTLDSDGDGFQDTCRVMDATCCAARDGTFRGAGSECSDEFGACCLGFDRICVEIDLTNCVEQNGRFQGLYTVCRGDEDGNGSDDACGEVMPAVSEWGLIVMTLLLLVGIKICFARRRPGFRAGQEA